MKGVIDSKSRWEVPEEFEGYIDMVISDLPERHRKPIGEHLA